MFIRLWSLSIINNSINYTFIRYRYDHHYIIVIIVVINDNNNNMILVIIESSVHSNCFIIESQ